MKTQRDNRRDRGDKFVWQPEDVTVRDATPEELAQVKRQHEAAARDYQKLLTRDKAQD